MIWFKPFSLSDWKSREKNTIHDSLGIEITEIAADSISGKMPIDKRTHQPMGILHGGASVVLAESLGSMGAMMVVDQSTHYAVGQSILANHIRPGIKGFVHGTAKMVHKGTRSQIWDIEITNDDKKLVCKCSLTMAVIAK